MSYWLDVIAIALMFLAVVGYFGMCCVGAIVEWFEDRDGE